MHMCGSEDNFEVCSFPSTVWVLGLDPKLSGLWVSTFTHQAVFAGSLIEPELTKCWGWLASSRTRLALSHQCWDCKFMPPCTGLHAFVASTSAVSLTLVWSVSLRQASYVTRLSWNSWKSSASGFQIPVSKDNLGESIFSFYLVGLRNWTQVIRLSGKHLCPLSHLDDL